MVEGNRDPERFSVDIEENAHETGNRLLEECNHSTANQFQSERATKLIKAPSVEQFHSRTAIQKPSEIQLPQFDFVDNGIIEFAERKESAFHCGAGPRAMRCRSTRTATTEKHNVLLPGS